MDQRLGRDSVLSEATHDDNLRAKMKVTHSLLFYMFKLLSSDWSASHDPIWSYFVPIGQIPRKSRDHVPRKSTGSRKSTDSRKSTNDVIRLYISTSFNPPSSFLSTRHHGADESRGIAHALHAAGASPRRRRIRFDQLQIWQPLACQISYRSQSQEEEEKVVRAEQRIQEEEEEV